MALIYLDDGHNKINGQIDFRLFHERTCDFKCGAMVSSFGRKVPKAGLQFMN